MSCKKFKLCKKDVVLLSALRDLLNSYDLYNLNSTRSISLIRSLIFILKEVDYVE